MAKELQKIIIILVAFTTFGCASTMPEHSKINNNYNTKDVKTYSVNIDYTKTKITDLQPNFTENYCPLLESNIKMSLQMSNPNWKYTNENPELKIATTLEQIAGGSAAARFWVGFGAGRSVTTALITVVKGDEVIAERRFNETTTMPNIITDNWTNETAIVQDAPIIAKKISEFVQDPSGFEKERSVMNDDSY